MAIDKVTLPVARMIAKKTQEDLAKACKVSVSTISNWEKGVTEPSISEAYTYADAVGRHIDELIFLS